MIEEARDDERKMRRTKIDLIYSLYAYIYTYYSLSLSPSLFLSLSVFLSFSFSLSLSLSLSLPLSLSLSLYLSSHSSSLSLTLSLTLVCRCIHSSALSFIRLWKTAAVKMSTIELSSTTDSYLTISKPRKRFLRYSATPI